MIDCIEFLYHIHIIIEILKINMILKTKDEILNWLKKYDGQYKKNIETNCYELIDIHDHINQALFNEMISKDNLPNDYFEKLKSEGHQYIINVKNRVDISYKELKEIPFQFYHVDGIFSCSHNQLTSLKGCPQYVGNGFSCNYNQLTSLKGCPQYVGNIFFCDNNQLTSLEYGPQVIEGYFYCQYNHLTSLEYFPEIVKQGFYLDFNTQLLKYKNQSNEPSIQNMSDDEFLTQRNFSFWHPFYLQEKINKENQKIIANLELNDNIENNPRRMNKL